MNRLRTNFLMLLGMLIFMSCEDEIRNIAAVETLQNPDTSVEVIPFDINTDGFDLLEKMQGQWVGSNRVIADDYDWFAFDYRAISPSHVHGIFEGGSMGNLLTSFFVADFKGTRTIMGRNGGVLNGIYRTSYFVLDTVENRSDGKYYRLVDAIGGDKIMYMELRFEGEQLFWNAYTSGLGNRMATRHMTFRGTKRNLDLAMAAAQQTNFPQNIPTWDFSDGFDTNALFVQNGETTAKSATFLAQQNSNDVFALAEQSGDPFKITDHPFLGVLQLDITRNTTIADQNLLVYFSKEALTDAQGFFTYDSTALDSILLFPVLEQGENQFVVTYLHPGEYYITIVADIDNNGALSQGDITHPLTGITIAPEEVKQLTIDNINIQN